MKPTKLIKTPTKHQSFFFQKWLKHPPLPPSLSFCLADIFCSVYQLIHSFTYHSIWRSKHNFNSFIKRVLSVLRLVPWHHLSNDLIYNVYRYFLLSVWLITWRSCFSKGIHPGAISANLFICILSFCCRSLFRGIEACFCKEQILFVLEHSIRSNLW